MTVGGAFRINLTVDNPNTVTVYCHFHLNMTLNNPAETVTADSVVVQGTNLSIYYGWDSSVDGNTWHQMIPYVSNKYCSIPPGTSHWYVELVLNTYCESIDYSAWFE
ncbi:MAG: hypothetical protein ACTSUQ_09895 [Candidatus Freyarchaeota archaeon]